MSRRGARRWMLFALVLLAALALIRRPSQAFSADLIVSELQMTFDEAYPLLPASLPLRSLKVIGIPHATLPGRQAADGALVADRRLQAGVGVMAQGADDIVSLESIDVVPGARLSLVKSPGSGELRWLFRNGSRSPGAPDAPSWSGLSVTLHGAMALQPARGPTEQIRFDVPTRLETAAPESSWELHMQPAEDAPSFLAPGLDVRELSFRITHDLLDPRSRGRFGDSSVRRGEIDLEGLTDSVIEVRPGEVVDVGSGLVRLDEVDLTPDGIRVQLHGVAESLRIGRPGRLSNRIPHLGELIYRTHWGPLVFAGLLALLGLYLEHLLDGPSR